LDEGEFSLAPGQKWLGTVASLTGILPGEGYQLSLFSQYNLESLVLRLDFQRQLAYAHRLFNTTLDSRVNNWITLSQLDPDGQSFVFANTGETTNWVLLEAYSEDGVSQGQIRIGGEPLDPREVRFFSSAEMMNHEVIQNASSPVTHFRMSAQRPLYVHELVGHLGVPFKTIARPALDYERP
jgi:hypothetical protein